MRGRMETKRTSGRSGTRRRTAVDTIGAGSWIAGARSERRERYRGCLLGLAAGDALGTTLELQLPGTFTPIDDMVGGGPFALRPGEWTDDTAMALCLAESLLAVGEFDAADQMRRYLRWYRQGYRSSTGRCFDIGNTVRYALHRFERSGEAFCDAAHPGAPVNGSLMRLAPVPMRFAADPDSAVWYAAESSRTTHATPEAVDACRYLAALIVGALQGRAKSELLAPHFAPVPYLWQREPLTPTIAAVAAGSFIHSDPPAIRGSGYVVRSLEAALWAFHRSDSFRAGALLAVNLGDDADTTGAIYGQLAGAHYGASAIPPGWGQRLAQRDGIIALADRLCAAAGQSRRRRRIARVSGRGAAVGARDDPHAADDAALGDTAPRA